MKKISLLALLVIILSLTLNAQNDGSTLFKTDQAPNRNNASPVNPDWAPFFHGVASGDPLEDRVIIWTRVTPDVMDGSPVEVMWKVATDVELKNIVQSGSYFATPQTDYTVKIDVTGLQSGTTYYYGFTALNQNSLTGKTKTTPSGTQADHLKFGVVSCSNYQAGYFNAYHRLADRTDLDAIIHLGDYIYEYADGVYGDSTLFEERHLDPENEIVTLEEYRTRYSTYRLDTNLIRAHQQHPFISVWDDHESANDAYTDGAENHDEATEGEWETRKAVSKQAYFEWMPIRETQDMKIYRTISYGDLMDLVLLDTRLEGRNVQIPDIQSPEFNDPDRTILGEEQKAWLFDQLQNSDARWKVIGQQVIFADLHVGWAALADPNANYYQVEGLFTDIWDGYPAERQQVIQFIEDNQIDNIVILTGDFHSSFGFDVSKNPTDVMITSFPVVGDAPVYSSSNDYDPATGEGSVAVEFATPSVTSANFDENTSLEQSLEFQAVINSEFVPIPGFSLGVPNPHMKYVDLIRHGYYILDVKSDSTQANWYYSDINSINDTETFDGAWYTKNAANHLLESPVESEPKIIQDVPAPNDPPESITSTFKRVDKFAVLATYPNPFSRVNTLNYSVIEGGIVDISLVNIKGRKIRQFVRERMAPGVYSMRFDATALPRGVYFYRIQVGDQVKTVKLLIQ